MEAEVLDYEIKSRLFVEGPYGVRRVNFVNSGTFSWGRKEAEAPIEIEVED